MLQSQTKIFPTSSTDILKEFNKNLRGYSQRQDSGLDLNVAFTGASARFVPVILPGGCNKQHTHTQVHDIIGHVQIMCCG